MMRRFSAVFATLVLGAVVLATGPAHAQSGDCHDQQVRLSAYQHNAGMWESNLPNVPDHLMAIAEQLVAQEKEKVAAAEQALAQCQAANGQADTTAAEAAQHENNLRRAAREYDQTVNSQPQATAPQLGGTIHSGRTKPCNALARDYGLGNNNNGLQCSIPSGPTQKDLVNQARENLRQAHEARNQFVQDNPGAEVLTTSEATGLSGFYIYWCIERNGKSGSDNLSTNCATVR